MSREMRIKIEGTFELVRDERGALVYPTEGRSVVVRVRRAFWRVKRTHRSWGIATHTYSLHSVSGRQFAASEEHCLNVELTELQA